MVLLFSQGHQRSYAELCNASFLAWERKHVPCPSSVISECWCSQVSSLVTQGYTCETRRKCLSILLYLLDSCLGRNLLCALSDSLDYIKRVSLIPLSFIELLLLHVGHTGKTRMKRVKQNEPSSSSQPSTEEKNLSKQSIQSQRGKDQVQSDLLTLV